MGSLKNRPENKNTYAATLLRRHKRGPLREILAVSGRGLAGKRVNKKVSVARGTCRVDGRCAGGLLVADGAVSVQAGHHFVGAEGELFFHIRHQIDADARFFRDGQITVLQLRDVVYHIALAQLDA